MSLGASGILLKMEVSGKKINISAHPRHPITPLWGWRGIWTPKPFREKESRYWKNACFEHCGHATNINFEHEAIGVFNLVGACTFSIEANKSSNRIISFQIKTSIKTFHGCNPQMVNQQLGLGWMLSSPERFRILIRSSLKEKISSNWCLQKRTHPRRVVLFRFWQLIWWRKL